MTNKKTKIICTVLLVFTLISTAAAFEKEITLDYSDYSVTEQEDYSLLNINAEGISLSDSPLSLVLPIGRHEHVFPKDTDIANMELIGFEDPVDLKIENLPSWNEEFVDRICIADKLEPRIDFIERFTETNQLVIVADIYPVEVVSCSDGDFKLYTTVRYLIEYTTDSPLTFVSHLPDAVDPASTMDLAVKINKLKEGSFTGEFIVESENITLARTDAKITKDEQIIQFSSKTPSRSGRKLIKISYAEDGTKLYTREYWIDVEGALMTIDAPDNIALNQQFQVKISLESNTEEPEAECRLVVRKGTTDTIRKNGIFQIKQGTNNLVMDVRTTGVKEGDYVINVDCYIGEDKFSSFRTLIIGEIQEGESKSYKFPKEISTIIAIIIGLASTIAVIYIAFKYLRTPKND